MIHFTILIHKMRQLHAILDLLMTFVDLFSHSSYAIFRSAVVFGSLIKKMALNYSIRAISKGYIRAHAI